MVSSHRPGSTVQGGHPISTSPSSLPTTLLPEVPVSPRLVCPQPPGGPPPDIPPPSVPRPRPRPRPSRAPRPARSSRYRPRLRTQRPHPPLGCPPLHTCPSSPRSPDLPLRPTVSTSSHSRGSPPLPRTPGHRGRRPPTLTIRPRTTPRTGSRDHRPRRGHLRQP